MNLRPRRLRLDEVRKDPELLGILLDHAYRGIRAQLLLRALLVVFMVLTVTIVPPAHDSGWCYLTVALYAVWVAIVTGWSYRGGERPVQFVWLALFVDVLALATITVLASLSDQQSWTADILLNGFFLIPMLATTQLRPGVGAVVTTLTVLVYLASSIAARHSNDEPWASVILRTGVLAALSLSCVLLSALQRSRVLTIAGLVSERTHLVSELADVEAQARRDLAEELHDGALQYVLAARQDLEDIRPKDGAESFDRVDYALRESTTLLRSKVTQLHPAVLEQSGLRRAIEELARTSAARAGLTVSMDAPEWDESWRLSADDLMYSAARELLANVTKHAQAQSVRVELSRRNGCVSLTISDDGKGIAPGALEQQLAKGHVGIVSQRVRIEAAGGRFTLRSASPGTVARVELPAIDVPPL
jgi:two-component system, NarL family, sensor kinase